MCGACPKGRRGCAELVWPPGCGAGVVCYYRRLPVWAILSTSRKAVALAPKLVPALRRLCLFLQWIPSTGSGIVRPDHSGAFLIAHSKLNNYYNSPGIFRRRKPPNTHATPTSYSNSLQLMLVDDDLLSVMRCAPLDFAAGLRRPHHKCTLITVPTCKFTLAHMQYSCSSKAMYYYWLAAFIGWSL